MDKEKKHFRISCIVDIFYGFLFLAFVLGVLAFIFSLKNDLTKEIKVGDDKVLETVDSKVDNLDNKLNDFVQKVNVRFNDYGKKIVEINGSIYELNKLNVIVNSHSEKLVEVDGVLYLLEERIDDVERWLELCVDEFGNKFVELDNRMIVLGNSIETTADALEVEIDELGNRYTTLNGKVLNLETDVSNDMSNLQLQINDLGQQCIELADRLVPMEEYLAKDDYEFLGSYGTKLNLLTSEPDNWATYYKDYYFNTGTEDSPVWSQLTSFREFEENTYYSMPVQEVLNFSCTSMICFVSRNDTSIRVSGNPLWYFLNSSGGFERTYWGSGAQYNPALDYVCCGFMCVIDDSFIHLSTFGSDKNVEFLFEKGTCASIQGVRLYYFNPNITFNFYGVKA